jgi:hypothetical protein
MKRILYLFVFTLLVQALTAHELELALSTLPEIQLKYSYRFVFPVMQGNSPLTENNNVALALSAEVAPVSLNGLVNAVWTPIAFLKFSTGGRIGSGLNANFLGADIYGIGLNLIGDDGKSVHCGKNFEALLWKTHLGALFQFDLAVIFPGAWNHVVFLTYHEINYHANTRAKANQAWFFEDDDGENMNGFNYYGNFFIGYQMPLFLNLVGFQTEMSLYLYDTPGRSVWGDDLVRWTFSGILNFNISKQIDVAMITQFKTRRNFLESNWEDLHYQRRTVNTSNPRDLEFYRVAAVLKYRF